MRANHQVRPETLLAAVGAFPAGVVYCRPPFSPRKNAHSSCHFLLRLIGSHGPAYHDRAFALLGLMPGVLPFSIRQPLTDRRLLRHCPFCILLGFFQFFARLPLLATPSIMP